MKLLTENKEVQLASLELGDEDVGPSNIAARVFKHYMGGPHFGEEYAEEVTQVRSMWWVDLLHILTSGHIIFVL